MKIMVYIFIFFVDILFADTLPLPQLNHQSSKWEYVGDGKVSTQTRLTVKSEDEKN